MYYTELSTPNMLVCVSMATAISITVFTITGQLCFLPVSVILLEKVVHNQGLKRRPCCEMSLVTETILEIKDNGLLTTLWRPSLKL